MSFTGYTTTSPFGFRNDPFGKGRKFHTGIDLVKRHLTPIFAFTEGKVMYAGFGNSGTGLGGYGNVVVVKDKNDCAQVYAHLNDVNVRTGATIKKGAIIGYQGNTGNSTGSHLHYEVRKKHSPSYGWISDRENNCHEPTKYLKDFYKPDKTGTYTGNSIVDYLKSVGIDSSYANRKKLAAKHGIKDYVGLSIQNIKLLDKLRK